MAGEELIRKLKAAVLGELTYFRRGIPSEALQTLSETLPLMIESLIESSVCDRCSRLDKTVKSFLECRCCGSIWLCDTCAVVHRREIADGEV